MSWLTSGLTQSVTGKISQISGQLKDILTEGTEEIYDPNNELKIVNDKLKNCEKHIEVLKMECSRWQEESNELNLKCQTYEAQLEQRQNEYRQQILLKDSIIAELRNQIDLLQNSVNQPSPAYNQKSVFMEEFEEIMPSSDLNDYIHLQKEIKRLKEDNIHLTSENKELLSKIKVFKAENVPNLNINQDEFLLKYQNYESEIENLKQEVYGLRNRLEMEKDKHQEDMITLQNSYTEKINTLSKENENFRSQVDMFESELEQANNLILKLKKPSTESVDSEHEELCSKIEKLESDIKLKEAEIDSMGLELKKKQQEIQHEKLIQLQEQKLERQEIAKLKSENTELKIKLDEKLSEINLLGDQINDLNKSINHLKSNDSTLFNELQSKTEKFLDELETANKEIASLKQEKEHLIEQRKQFEFVLDEKSRENSQLKLDIQKNVQHIAAQSKALEKLQSDLKFKLENESKKSDNSAQTDAETENELNLLKNQYNQIYTYLEQKNQESLSYYNEIQRLNQIISELNRELLNSKNLNENLHDQYDNLLKGLQLEQKIVDDLNQQTFELNNTILNIKADADQQKADLKYEHESIEKYENLLKDFEGKINDLSRERDDLLIKLKETENYYEELLKSQSNAFKASLTNEEQQKLKLSKELERLKEHLVEISDSYTKEAIQAEEREKQLRLALYDAQNMLQQQGASLETSSKEVTQKLEQLSLSNQELKAEKEKLNQKLKQTEDNFNHQVKVTKNLELVLERLQNEKDGQHSLEVTKYQQTIKENVSKIQNLQKENQKYEHEIEQLKEDLEAITKLEFELNEKDAEIKNFKTQLGSKDALIESLEKRFNEVQKLNDSYIEKEIIKNLIIGYIKVNQQQEKKQVLKLIATMLSFSPAELETVEHAGESKWFGLLKTNTSPKGKQTGPSSTDGLNKSFTELLIQYVDRESRPKPNLQFDLNKKTDNLNDSNLSNSESAINYFNSSLINSNSILNPDLTLVNRSGNNGLSNNSTMTSNSTSIPGVSSPAVANSFLEQILK